MAYEDEQEEAFLTTQQVDEARHMQFFDRWFREVAGGDDEDGGIQERLVKMGEQLIADPGDIDLKVDFVTAYHKVFEGTLALTGQHFMLDYYESND
jgi:ribonucleoside-diphosphate reductase beta chain